MHSGQIFEPRAVQFLVDADVIHCLDECQPIVRRRPSFGGQRVRPAMDILNLKKAFGHDARAHGVGHDPVGQPGRLLASSAHNQLFPFRFKWEAIQIFREPS